MSATSWFYVSRALPDETWYTSLWCLQLAVASRWAEGRLGRLAVISPVQHPIFSRHAATVPALTFLCKPC